MDVTCPFGSQAFDKASQDFVYKPEEIDWYLYVPHFFIRASDVSTLCLTLGYSGE